MFSRIALLTVFCCFATAISFVDANEAGVFTFYDYMQGDWTVTKSTLSVSAGDVTVDEVHTKYKIGKDEGSDHLTGTSQDIDVGTNETSNELAVFLQFEDMNKGKWMTGEDESSLAALYEFEFTELPNGQWVSHGTWETEKKTGYYQFVVASPILFTLTVTPSDTKSDDEIFVYSGKKTPIMSEKTFFQKYGSILMIGGFMAFNMFVKSKTAAAQAVPARGASARPSVETSTGSKAGKKE